MQWEGDLPHERLHRMVTRWKRHVAIRDSQETWDLRTIRGGAPKTQKSLPPWESTEFLKGTRLLSEVTCKEKKLKEITIGMITEESEGVALCLIATWSKLPSRTYTKPLLLVFPGQCARVLAKMGAQEDAIRQMELLMADDRSSSPFNRKVTILEMFKEDYRFGSNIRGLEWAPSIAVELHLEFNGRWAPTLTLQNVRGDWGKALRHMLATMVAANIVEVPIFGHREPNGEGFGDQQVVWHAKCRMGQEMAEKALASSGTDGLFIKPTDVTMMGGKEAYTIIWSTRHELASSTELARIMAVANRLLGHRGLARSVTAIGLRCKWEQVAEARKHLRPSDPRWNTENLGLRDSLSFLARKLPFRRLCG